MTYPINCNNDNCPKNCVCHRFMAEPGENQRYVSFEFRNKINRLTHKPEFGCYHFYSMPSKTLGGDRPEI